MKKICIIGLLSLILSFEVLATPPEPTPAVYSSFDVAVTGENELKEFYIPKEVYETSYPLFITADSWAKERYEDDRYISFSSRKSSDLFFWDLVNEEIVTENGKNYSVYYFEANEDVDSLDYNLIEMNIATEVEHDFEVFGSYDNVTYNKIQENFYYDKGNNFDVHIDLEDEYDYKYIKIKASNKENEKIEHVIYGLTTFHLYLAEKEYAEIWRNDYQTNVFLVNENNIVPLNIKGENNKIYPSQTGKTEKITHKGKSYTSVEYQLSDFDEYNFIKIFNNNQELEDFDIFGSNDGTTYNKMKITNVLYREGDGGYVSVKFNETFNYNYLKINIRDNDDNGVDSEKLKLFAMDINPINEEHVETTKIKVDYIVNDQGFNTEILLDEFDPRNYNNIENLVIETDEKEFDRNVSTQISNTGKSKIEVVNGTTRIILPINFMSYSTKGVIYIEDNEKEPINITDIYFENKDYKYVFEDKYEGEYKLVFADYWEDYYDYLLINNNDEYYFPETTINIENRAIDEVSTSNLKEISKEEYLEYTGLSEYNEEMKEIQSDKSIDINEDKDKGFIFFILGGLIVTFGIITIFTIKKGK